MAMKKHLFNYWSEIYISAPDENFFEATTAAHLSSQGLYNIWLRKRIVKLLGLPYTDCVKGPGNYSQNKFIGNYSIPKCQRGCLLEKVFEKCSAIPPMYKKHLREPHRFENKTLVNNTFGKDCMQTIRDDEQVRSECDALCHLRPCYEVQIVSNAEYQPYTFVQDLAIHVFAYKNFLVEIIEEVPAYTWEELFSNFGGCVGLMTGASILSLVELCIFIGLLIFDHFDICSKVRPSKTVNDNRL